jgi:hypothetical protein
MCLLPLQRKCALWISITHLNRTERDPIQINLTEDCKWIDHYKTLWCSNTLQNNSEGIEENISENIDKISYEELEQSLCSLKNSKATSPEGLNAKFFKHGGVILSHRLLKFINWCWKERSIPDEWKQATVKSSFKKAECNNCSNYRGISLLNSGYEIYSKIITISK